MSFVFLIIFVVSYFLHLTARFPILGAIRFDVIIGFTALILAYCQSCKDMLRYNEITARRLSHFLLYIVISLPLVTWPGSVIRYNLEYWSKVAFLFLLFVAIVRTEKRLQLAMSVFIACQIFRAVEPLYLHLTEGYWGDMAYSAVEGSLVGLHRLSGAPSDVVNPNQLAWVIVTDIPFLFYLCWLGRKWWEKVFFLMAVPPLIESLLLTGSRSGLISLATTIMGMILLSKKKGRNLIVVIFLVLPFAMLILGGLSRDLQTRYLSIWENNVAGADTREGRINALFKQLDTVSHNPLFGNGLGTSAESNVHLLGSNPQPTHDLYIEIIQETGVVGFILFTLFIVSLVKSLIAAKKMLSEEGDDGNSWLFRLIMALQVWVFMDLFYALSCFGLSSWEWYFFGGVTTVSVVLVKERLNLRGKSETLMPLLTSKK